MLLTRSLDVRTMWRILAMRSSKDTSTSGSLFSTASFVRVSSAMLTSSIVWPTNSVDNTENFLWLQIIHTNNHHHMLMFLNGLNDIAGHILISVQVKLNSDVLMIIYRSHASNHFQAPKPKLMIFWQYLSFITTETSKMSLLDFSVSSAFVLQDLHTQDLTCSSDFISMGFFPLHWSLLAFSWSWSPQNYLLTPNSGTYIWSAPASCQFQ